MIPTQYHVMKTGFEMADVCRVYGVAELLRKASLETGGPPHAPPRIRDASYMWLVDAPQVSMSEAVAQQVTTDITAPLGREHAKAPEGNSDVGWFLAHGWNYLYVTNQAKDKAKALDTLQQSLPRALWSLADPQKGGKAGTLTTPQGLETAGGKGSRAASRNTYGEGQSEMPGDHWAVAVVGAMAVGTYLWPKKGSGQGNLALVPVPADVTYDSHLEIRDDLRAGGILCPVSSTTAVAHFAVKLARHQSQRQADTTGWANRYSAVAYEAMAPTGQRPKPAHGGMFPMDALNALIGGTQESAARAEVVLGVWDKLLQTAGMNKGMETLALTLTDFLMHPTLSNLERHWRTHLRFSLREEGDKKRVRTFYPEAAMEGLMAHVTT